MKQEPKLKDAIKILGECVANAIAHVDAIDPSDISTLARTFKQLKDAKELLDVEVKILGELYHNISYVQFPFVLEQMELDSVKVGGYSFSLSERVMANIPEAKREAGFKWIRDVAGTPELIKPSVNSKSLSTVVKAHFEANAIWPPEEAVTVHIQPFITVRKT